MKRAAVIFLLSLAVVLARAEEGKTPVHLIIIGLVHDAVGDFIERAGASREVQLVGIVEAKPELTARYGRLFHLGTNFFANSLEELLARTNVQPAAVFTSTLEHRMRELCPIVA